jgi:hypothetical protein
LRSEQRLGLRPIGGQMQIGEQHLVTPQPRTLIGLRLFDFYDEL